MWHLRRIAMSDLKDKKVKIKYYEPDYTQCCTKCGAKPVVVGIRSKFGREEIAYRSGMCGPCTFCTADAVDPENWNWN